MVTYSIYLTEEPENVKMFLTGKTFRATICFRISIKILKDGPLHFKSMFNWQDWSYGSKFNPQLPRLSLKDPSIATDLCTLRQENIEEIWQMKSIKYFRDSKNLG